MSNQYYVGIERQRLSVLRQKEAARAQVLAEEKRRNLVQQVLAATERRLKAIEDSGLSPEQLDELQHAQRKRREQGQASAERRHRDFCAGFVAKGALLPTPQDVANALTAALSGGALVSLAALLVESGSARDIGSAVRLCKQRHGRAVVAHLRELHWVQTRRSAGILWEPPDAVR